MRKFYSTLLATSLLTFILFSVFTGCQQINNSGTIPGSEEENDKYDGPDKAIQFEIEKTKDPVTGKVPWQNLRIAIEQTELAKTQVRSNRPDAIESLTWTERGPDGDFYGPQGNTRPNNGQTSGRIRATMVDSLDPTHRTVIVGSVAGGLWKTSNITASLANWILVNDFMSNLAIADICQDPRPGFQNNLYVCTGESYSNSDAIRGVGVFKSTDDGVTWNFLPSTSSYVNGTRILCDNLGNVYLGTRGSGLLRSIDGGATWTSITPSGLSNDICDLEISSTALPGRLHVTTGIFSASGYRYTDIPATVTSGAGWNTATTPFTTFNERTELGISGNVLYALPDNGSHQVPTIWKSTDGGDNWAATAVQPTSGWANGQGWYSLSCGVNPANSNECIVGGLDCYKTSDGGGSWTHISTWVGTSGQYVHADQHDIQWWDGGTKLLFSCDGGIHYSSDGGTTISDRNKGLRIKQFYSVAIHPLETNYFLAGAQDNGIHRLNHPGLDSSIEVEGGDGMLVAIDQNEPQYQFGSYVYNVYRRSTNNGASWSTPINNQASGRFVNPWDYDNTGNILYACNTGGNYMRWDNPQTGATTTIVSVAAFSGATVSAVDVSPYTTNRVYFGMGSGGIIQVDNANTGTTATGTVITPAGAAGYANCVVTGSSDQNLMATYSSYNVTHVWVSTNGGTSWTACDGNLPNMPVRWALFHPDTDTKAYIATETGVWETTLLNGASTIWTPSTTFPNVSTDMIKYRASDRTIAAGTHGRGIWTATVPLPTGFSFDSPSAASSVCPAPASMQVTLTATFSSGFTNPITLSASGNPAGTSVSFGNNPLTPGSPSSTVVLTGTNTLTPGSYVITVTGTATGAPTQTRNLTYTITPGAGPSITLQPSNQTLCAGGNTSFNITATTATTFQWLLSTDAGVSYNPVSNGGVYSGATTNTLNLTGVPAGSNNYLFRCTASTLCGSTTSSAALLTVNTAPAITAQPQNITLCTGGSNTFSVTASGANLTYQWQLSTDGGTTYNPIGGATLSTYTVSSVTAGMNGYRYRCLISGSCPPSVTSAGAILTVVTSLSITSQPSDVITCVGNITSFIVTATGANITYQWQVSTDGGATYTDISNGGVYSGATTATLNLIGVTAILNGNRYRCNLTSTCGNATTNSVLLTVNTLPAITGQPQDITLCAGSNNTFSVTATGTSITYQWQLSTDGGATYNNVTNGGVYSGATTPNLTLTGITAGMNNYKYRCIVTGVCNPPAVSAAATLSVITSVAITSQPANVTACAGTNASFTVSGSGAGIIYQWQVSTDGGATWNNITIGGVYSGATNATLTITGATVSMNGYKYRALLSNATCTTPGISNPATLTVNSLPAISTNPQDATICIGGSNTFSVTASGTGISYQWQLSTDGGVTYNNIAGATTSSYTVSGAIAGMNGNRYRCVVNGTCPPAATSVAALLTVISPVVITAQPPNSAEGCSGNSATFTVVGTSTQTIIYQWQVSTDGGATWTNITGANAAAFTISNLVVVLNNNRYRALLSNATCTVPTVSNAAILTVHATPTVGLTAAPLTSLLPGQSTTLTATPSAPTGGVLTTTWYNNNTLFPNVGNTYLVTVANLGSYQVKIQETWPSSLFCSNLSQVVTIDATISQKLFIFPSPNDGHFTVSYYNNGGSSTQRQIVIFDSRGAMVYNRQFPIAGPYTLINVNLERGSRGIYYVVVGDSNGKKLADGKVHVR